MIGHGHGRASLYFHASTATSAVLDAKGTEKLRAALESLGSTGCQTGGGFTLTPDGQRIELD